MLHVHDFQGNQVSDVLSDFSDAQQRAITLDQRITNDALGVSTDYRDLVSFTARQTIGATEITVSRDTNGDWNMSDIKMFMKDIGNGR
jgi:hypothetical protein